VEAVRSGTEGLVATQRRPDLVILDGKLPDLAAEAFRAEQRRAGRGDVPVLMLTGADATVWQDLNTPVLPMPFDLDELLECVRQCVGSPVRTHEGTHP
jgi:DNA-binding response OmpR family regulator